MSYGGHVRLCSTIIYISVTSPVSANIPKRENNPPILSLDIADHKTFQFGKIVVTQIKNSNFDSLSKPNSHILLKWLY